MTIFLIIFLTLFILGWVGFPLVQAGQGRRLDHELWVERRRSLMNSLDALYHKKETGEIEEDDFVNIEAGILKNLAACYQKLGEDPTQSDGPACHACGAPLKASYQHCVACGTRVVQETSAEAPVPQPAESLS
ncbi:hypothetical protein [Acanthopleuribacter pedis]|uniref:Zinc ribbon domain-containing protein n=1 Tax=Acanthopleuribacter pedis TaxID=442870 RepID=A0A8J7QGW8_9BACT|nr:hypothetical protein [Acanthopleuribacter pedis]MBO1322140.1 hypothetical protein [Acanthopleuribacter pedis]